MSKQFSELIWVEKYRPKKLEHILLPQRIKERFKKELGAHLLLGGSSGLGKTTLAKILTEGRSVLFINGSSTRGIDIVRNDINEFARTNSLISNKKKIILVDEGDKFTKDAQDALKAIIEIHHKNVFFIFTANNPERLDEHLKSRLEYINFNFTEEESKEQKIQYVKRIQGILQNEGNFRISNDALKYILKNLYPDLRQIINVLYKATRSLKEGSIVEVKHLSDSILVENTELYEKIVTEWRPEAMYKFVKSTYSGKEFETLSSLGTHFLEYLNSNEKHQSKTLPAAIVIHKYIYEATTGSINPLIPLLACVGMLSNLFKS